MWGMLRASGLLSASAIGAVKRSTLAVGSKLALRTDFAVGHAVAGVTNLAICTACAITARHTEGAALSVGTLTARTTVGVGLALRNSTLISAANAGDANVVRIHSLAVSILTARRMANTVDAGLSSTTLSTGHASLVVDGLRCTVQVLTGAPGTASSIAGAGFFAQSVNARTTGTALTVEHAVIRRNGCLLALTVQTLAARSAVGLNSAGLRWCGRCVRLARVPRCIAGVATRTVGLLVAVASLSTLTVATAVTAGRTIGRRHTGRSRGTAILGNTARGVALETPRHVTVGVKTCLVCLSATLLREQCEGTQKRRYKR